MTKLSARKTKLRFTTGATVYHAGREPVVPPLGTFPKRLEKRKVGVNFPSKMPFPVKGFNIRDLTYGVTQQYKYKRKKEQKQNQKQFLAFCPGRSTK